MQLERSNAKQQQQIYVNKQEQLREYSKKYENAQMNWRKSAK